MNFVELEVRKFADNPTQDLLYLSVAETLENGKMAQESVHRLRVVILHVKGKKNNKQTNKTTVYSFSSYIIYKYYL